MLQYLYKNWAHAGLLIAVYVTLLLVSVAQCLDPYVFLVWLQFPVYLVHEFEEHAWPGGFKTFVNKNVFGIQNADEPLTDARVFWINILGVWVLFPVAAFATQFVNPLYGLLAPCFGLFNASLHIVWALGLRRYNPGLLVSAFLNYPTGIYTIFVARKMGYFSMPALLGASAFAFMCHLIIFLAVLYWYQEYSKNKKV